MARTSRRPSAWLSLLTRPLVTFALMGGWYQTDPGGPSNMRVLLPPSARRRARSGSWSRAVFQDVHAIAGLMADYAGPWAFCGAWAIDLFLDRETRAHKDVDIAIARRDQLLMQAYLAGRGWHLQIAHQGTLTDWQPGEYVELPRHGIWGQHPTAEP